MSACLFCGSLQRNFSIKFCQDCGSVWGQDVSLDDPNQVAQYCHSLYLLFDDPNQVGQYCSILNLIYESTQDDPLKKMIVEMREQYKISHHVHSRLVEVLIAKLKVVESLSGFLLEFDENVSDAYAKEDTFLRFRFANRSKSGLFKSAVLDWDDPETADNLDYKAKSQGPIKAGANCELTSTHVFQRFGRKQISEMYLTVENLFGHSAKFLVSSFYFTVGNPDQKVVNHITTHTQITMERGVVDNSNNEGSKKLEVERDMGSIGVPKWREMKTHIVLEPPKDLAEILFNNPSKNIPPPPVNKEQDKTAEIQEEKSHETGVASQSSVANKAGPRNIREASESVFKSFHQLNSITPFADSDAVIYAANFSLDFLDLVFTAVPDETEDEVLGMIFENGPSVVSNAQDDVINFSGNAVVFSVAGITAVTCLESIFEGQVHYSWAEVGANDWTFYRRRFGENSYLISFGDGAAGQNFPGCKFDLRKYQGDLSLNDVFTSAENALAKVIELAPPLPLPDEVEGEEEEEEEEEEFEDLVEEEAEIVIDNSALIELDSRLQRFFSLFTFALQFCKEGQPKSVFTESEVGTELMDHLYEVIHESGTGLSPEGIFHLVKDPNGDYALDGSSCFLSWSKFFKDYKGNLFIREHGPDIWFGTQSNYMIQACYADYSSGVLQWDYFEEFIRNDLVESFQLFKEATEWDV
ncbi:MAG: hypothetical protein ACKVOY_00440 [Burkholderiaceae bacterium]